MNNECEEINDFTFSVKELEGLKQNKISTKLISIFILIYFSRYLVDIWRSLLHNFFCMT